MNWILVGVQGILSMFLPRASYKLTFESGRRKISVLFHKTKTFLRMRNPKPVTSDLPAASRRCPQWIPWVVLFVVLLQLGFFFRVHVTNSSYFKLSIESFTQRWKIIVYSTPRPGSLSRPLGKHLTVEEALLEKRTSQNLSSNRSFCEAWLEDKDRVVYDRNFSETPIIVSSGEYRVWSSCAIGCIFRNPSSSETADASIGLRKGSRTVSVLSSMESSSYYSENNLQNARRMGYDVVMTTSLASDVPVGYFSWAEYDLMAPMKEKTEKALAAAFISNCGAHNFRLEAISQLQKHGVTIDSYGACLRNRHQGRVDKLRTLQQYKFSLAFENSNEEDYVTEKFWQSLVAGTVPIVIGAPNIQDFVPAKNSILHIKSMSDVPNVAKKIKHLASNESKYNEALRWKIEGPSDSFKALVDMAVVHSSCRLCLFLGTKIRLEEENMKNISLSRPCHCTQDSETIYHLYVRERGKFEMESVFLGSNEMTIEGLHHAIISKFESLNYEPIWSAERPKMIKGDGRLRIYKVYPVGMTQRQALYGWGFSNDDKVRSFVKTNPCAKLEVIFI